METTTDRLGNQIGNGVFHAEHWVIKDCPENVTYSIGRSESTESVYITYSRTDSDHRITVRFSNHVNNAVEFGDQLDGYRTNRNEILYHLGLKKRTFVPDTQLSIASRMVKKADVQDYEEAELTIQEMYDLGAGADLSAYTGKIAKGGRRLILGTKVEQMEVARVDRLGGRVRAGKYIYENL